MTRHSRPTLRWYQRECLEAIQRSSQNVVACLPTGAGKSHVIAELAKQIQPARVLILAHVQELLEQNTDKLRAHWPDAPIGIWCAGLDEKTTAQVTVASVQSAYFAPELLGAFDLIVIDEAHRVPNNDDTMYRRILAHQKSLNPVVRVVGFTATPFREKTGPLHQGKDAIFDELVYDVPVQKLIEEGWLCRIIGRSSIHAPSLAGVRTQYGDYVQHEMAGVYISSSTIHAIDEMLVLAENRSSILIFAASVGHAGMIETTLHKRNESSVAVVTATTEGEERKRAVDMFRRRQLRMLINCGVYTTGFDAPNVDCIVLLRATKSLLLYQQMVGRGLRTAPDKTDCLLLDYGHNIARHGPIGTKPKPLPPTPKITVLPTTSTLPASTPRPVTVAFTASFVDPLQPQRSNRIAIARVTYRPHYKANRPPSMRVSYFPTDLTQETINEWVCWEHGGWATKQAHKWSKSRGIWPPPKTTEAALDIVWPQPKTIAIDRKLGERWWRVVDVEF